jgi:hypothetical protein
MSHRNSILLMMALSLIAMPSLTQADEQIAPLAISGNWVAAAHRASMTAPTDVCIVENVASCAYLRADADHVELRVENQNWALLTAVQGEISLSISQWKTLLDIGANSNTMVAAIVSSDIIVPMFAAMDNAFVMAATVGKAKPVIVSLAGSTRATKCV